MNKIFWEWPHPIFPIIPFGSHFPLYSSISFGFDFDPHTQNSLGPNSQMAESTNGGMGIGEGQTFFLLLSSISR
jgi:hypothetical protein